jgi:hypothetical protein
MSYLFSLSLLNQDNPILAAPKSIKDALFLFGAQLDGSCNARRQGRDQ